MKDAPLAGQRPMKDAPSAMQRPSAAFFFSWEGLERLKRVGVRGVWEGWG